MESAVSSLLFECGYMVMAWPKPLSLPLTDVSTELEVSTTGTAFLHSTAAAHPGGTQKATFVFQTRTDWIDATLRYPAVQNEHKTSRTAV